jgi:hypothetical protein
MSDPSNPYIRVRAVRLVGWRAVGVILAGLAVFVAVAALLALSILFIVLPAVAIGAVAYYFLPKRPGPALGNQKAADRAENTTIIDGDYRATNDATKEAEDGNR